MIQIRVDDFPHTKGEPQHTPEAFLKFHRLLSGHLDGARYLLGIIPGRCVVDDWQLLKEISREIEPGVHGVTHSEESLDRHQNEFPPWTTQRSIRTILSGCRSNLWDRATLNALVYMPPRNRIDRRTLSVLPDAGYIAYTGGPETADDCKSGQYLTYIDSQPPFEYGRSDELLARGAVEYLRSQQRDVTLTLHWTWETNIGLEHLDRFLGEFDDGFLTGFTV